MANVTFHYNMVMDNAVREETRKRLYLVHDNLAREKNLPVLNQMLDFAQSDRAAARLQVMGRFPDRSENGEERRRPRQNSSTIWSLEFNRSSTPK